MMSNERVMNTKVSYLIKIYNLYLGHFVIFKSDNNMYYKFDKSQT